MSVNVVITCSFPVAKDDELPDLAREHWEDLEQKAQADTNWGLKEPRNMLLYAADGNGLCCGRNGYMFTWGIEGNYTQADKFVGELHDFFLDLYNFGVISCGNGIVVQAQREQDRTVHRIQIRSPYWDDSSRPPYIATQLIVEEQHDATGPAWGWYK
jgi:hypothetical protein